MQDDTPVHIARMTQQLCSEDLPGFLEEGHQTPLTSKHLSTVGESLSVHHRPPLSSSTLGLCGKIEPSTLTILVHSMPERLTDVIKVKGWKFWLLNKLTGLHIQSLSFLFLGRTNFWDTVYTGIVKDQDKC